MWHHYQTVWLVCITRYAIIFYMKEDIRNLENYVQCFKLNGALTDPWRFKPSLKRKIYLVISGDSDRIRNCLDHVSISGFRVLCHFFRIIQTFVTQFFWSCESWYLRWAKQSEKPLKNHKYNKLNHAKNYLFSWCAFRWTAKPLQRSRLLSAY